MMRKLLVLGALVFGGCLAPQDSTGVGNPGLTTSEEALVADGDDGTKAGDSASAIVAVPMLALGPGDLADAPTAAARVTSGTPVLFSSGCVTTARDANKVTLTFNNCGGRLGLAGVKGQLVATYTVSAPGEIAVAISTEPGFTAEGLGRDLRPLTFNVTLTGTALIKFEAGTRKIRWNGNYSASVATFLLTHEPSYDVVFDEAKGCVSLDGVATTNRDKPNAVTTTIAGYVRCGPKNICPNAGGKVTHTRVADGAQLTIEFLGGTSARVTGPKRGTVVLPNLLKCSPG